MSITTRNQYFFHIREGDHQFSDDVGHKCATLQHAEAEAAITCISLMRDAAAKGIYEPVCVDVTDAGGTSLVTVNVSVKVERAI